MTRNHQPSRLPVFFVLSTAVIAACGGGKPANAPEHAAASWTAPASASGFGGPIVDASRAMLAAARGRAYDAGWNCGDATSDLRATTAETKQQVAALGDMASLVLAAVKLTMVSPAKDDVDPSEVPDWPGKGPVRVFMQAYATVSPEGHVSWADVSAYLAALEEPNPDRAKIKSLAPPIRAELTRLADGAQSPDCRVAIMSEADLDALPYPLQKDERDVILAKLALVQRSLPRVCKAASRATGGWEAHFSHVETVVRGGTTLATLRSKLSIQNDALCLGRVEVVKVVAVQ